MLRNSSSAGVALFMVLILTTLMYLLVSTLLLVTMTEIHLADFEQRATQALYAAESSVALGISRLRTNSLYRSETSETLPVGKNIGMVTVKFYDGTDDGNGYYRSALDPSRYRLILQGVGSVPGAQSMAKRTIEREVLIKPFAIFARNSLRVRGGCTIRGNIHANGTLTLEAGTTITGDVTSSTEVNSHGEVDGHVSSAEALEPEIPFPEIEFHHYVPRYLYDGIEYEAQPLVKETILLEPDEGVDPPEPGVVTLYSGFATAENPAGVFYPKTPITGQLNALDVEGTVVIPSTYPGSQVTIMGTVRINAVDHFPALLSAKPLSITLVGNLERFSGSFEKSAIQGLIYVQGNLSLTGNNTTGDVIAGSVFGHTLTLTGHPVLRLTYTPTIMSTPPPGLDLIELGAWREVLE